jgi:hypothetical protein
VIFGGIRPGKIEKRRYEMLIYETEIPEIFFPNGILSHKKKKPALAKAGEGQKIQ